MTEIHEGTTTAAPKAGANPGDTGNRKQSPGSEARYVATQKLIENHRDEFEEIYEEEAKKRGATTKKMRKDERVAKLRAQLAELEPDARRDDSGDPDRTSDLGGNPVE